MNSGIYKLTIAKMRHQDIRETLQVIDLLCSVVLFGFFVYQRVVKQRCKFEVLYVTGVGSITDLIKLVATDEIPGKITIAENGVVLNWSQYFGWLITCPVLLIHLSNLAGTDTFDARRMMKMLVAYQILMMSGVTASMCDTDNPLKWIFFGAALLCLSMLYRYAYHIFTEATTIMPARATHTIWSIAVIFYGSWSGFGLFWVLGPTGSRLISDQLSKAGFALCDILSKNVYSMCGWYLRWYILRKFDNPKEFVDQEVNDHDTAQEKVRIGLLECNPIYTHFLTEQLLRHNYSVVACSDFTQFHSACSEKMVDMLLVNFDIAEHNEFVLMYQIRSSMHHLPVIAYSNHIDPSYIHNKHITGIDDFISAPFPDNIIQKKVLQWSRRASIVPVAQQSYSTRSNIQAQLHQLQKSLDDILGEYPIS